MKSTAPQETQSLLLDGPAGKLECILEIPADYQGRHAALLCHPHPLYQGTMHNKVVHTLARSMHDMDIATLRFNFRGVGLSEGSYAEGHGETDDAVLLATRLSQLFPMAELWLAGFSFGGMVAALAACRIDAAQLITIAPAVGMLAAESTAEPAVPWLLVHGADDELIPVAAVLEWAEGLARPPEIVVMPATSHFFHGQLVALRKLLVERLAPSL
jgi:uncharacterized protein